MRRFALLINRSHRLLLVLVAVAGLVAPLGPVEAQQAEPTRAGVRREPKPVEAFAAPTVVGAPISPRRAFLYSILLPGAGQARLDRGRAGSMFFLIEIAALTLVHRSAEDFRIARAAAGDSMPLRYSVDAVTGRVNRDPKGAPVVAAWSVPRYNDAYVRTRRLHYEDWLAVIAFNHLFAGADAFVAAQLWDLPARIGVGVSPDGVRLEASLRR
ncbi:MAG: hypothetical protein FJ361_09810 [Gemmatimonadetes bacterium]|nr:hypothetical protein [Gemmatimonadota bacterium]